jgi:hypothetical protein
MAHNEHTENPERVVVFIDEDNLYQNARRCFFTPNQPSNIGDALRARCRHPDQPKLEVAAWSGPGSQRRLRLPKHLKRQSPSRVTRRVFSSSRRRSAMDDALSLILGL